MRINNPHTNPLLAAVTYHFGGGGAPTPPKAEKIELPPTPQVQIPTVPPPAPPPPPPPTKSALEEQEGRAQAARDAKRRRGMAQSLLAGETGGANSATGKSSLLGNNG